MAIVRVLALLAALALPIAAAPGAWAQELTVHQLSIKGDLLDERERGGELEIFRVGFGTNTLIQLASGRPVDERPPSNEVLAVVASCLEEPRSMLQLVVWDTDEEEILVELTGPIDVGDEERALFETRDLMTGVEQVRFVADFDVNEVGEEGNAIDGGDWKGYGVAGVDRDFCVTRLALLSFMGTLQLTATVGGETLEFDAIVFAEGESGRPIAVITDE